MIFYFFLFLSNYVYCQEWRFHQNKAGEYFVESNYKEEIEHYNKELQFKPNLIYSLRMRASCKLLSNDNKGALIDYILLIKIKPNDKDLYYGRAVCKTRLKMFESACLDLKKAKELGYEGEIIKLKGLCKS